MVLEASMYVMGRCATLVVADRSAGTEVEGFLRVACTELDGRMAGRDGGELWLCTCERGMDCARWRAMKDLFRFVQQQPGAKARIYRAQARLSGGT